VHLKASSVGLLGRNNFDDINRL